MSGARGRFITLEGGEGVGKSTQARLLAAALRARGLAAVETREPGGTPGAEDIRALILSGSADRWGVRAEALLFAAARADHVERVIAPALAQGQWVVCDRYLDSTRAYQGADGGMTDADVMALHRIGTGGLMPDRTLVLSLAPETAAMRAANRGSGDRIEARDAGFHAGVAARFAVIAEREPGRVRLIDAEGAAEDVHARLLAALADLLPC